MTGINPQPHRQIHGLVEFGVLDLLEQADRLGERIGRLNDSRARLHDVLAVFSHSFLVSHRPCQPRFAECLRLAAEATLFTLPERTLEQAQKPWCL
jgi:hypothetical protein